jgi:hypothetical protein
MTRATLATLLIGLLMGTLATGWAMEYRLQSARLRDAQQHYAELLGDLVVVHEALRIAEPDPVKRATAGQNAYHNVGKIAKGAKP